MRSNSNGRSAQSQLVVGVLVIAIGTLFLLDNLGIVDLRRALAFWPLALIVLGVVKLFDTSSPNGYLFGVVLVALGLTMIANRLGFFYLVWDTTWPLLLIAAGALVVFRAMTARRAPLPLKHAPLPLKDAPEPPLKDA